MAASRTAGMARRPATTADVGAAATCSGRAGAARSRAVVREAISHAVHREQVARLARIRLELPADVLHVRVDRALVRLERDAVHRVEELRPCEDAARCARERGEELELGRRELLDLGVTD